MAHTPSLTKQEKKTQPKSEPIAEVPTKTKTIPHTTGNTLALPSVGASNGSTLALPVETSDSVVEDTKSSKERRNSRPDPSAVEDTKSSKERRNSRPDPIRLGTRDSTSSRNGERASGEGRLKPLLPRSITFTDADYVAPPIIVRHESNLFLSILIFAACIAGFVGIWYVLNNASTTMLMRDRKSTRLNSSH